MSDRLRDLAGFDKPNGRGKALLTPHQTELSTGTDPRIVWGDPNLPGTDHAPPYPIDMLPAVIRRAVQTIAGHTQTPADIPALVILTALSGTIANKYKVRARWIERPQMWSISVAATGLRKSPVHRAALGPIEEWEREKQIEAEPIRKSKNDRLRLLDLAIRHQEGIVARKFGTDEAREAEAALIRLANDRDAVTVPPWPRLLLQDVTSERLAAILAENGTEVGIVSSDEGDIVDVVAGRYSDQAAVGVWKHGYDCDRHQEDRLSRDPVRVDQPAIAAVIQLQDSVLEEIRNLRSLKGQGFLGRPWYAVPPNTVGRRLTGASLPVLDTGAVDAYRHTVRRLLDLPYPADLQNPPTLFFGADALAVMDEFEEWVEPRLAEDNELDPVADWGRKLVGRAVRLAAVLHCIRHEHPDSHDVGPEDAEVAVEFAKASVPHARAAYLLMGRDSKETAVAYAVRKLDEITDRTGSTTISRTDFYEATRRNRHTEKGSRKATDKLIAELEARDIVRTDERKTAGRTATDIHVNPAVLEANSP